jgi:hypothetical protein
MHYISNLKTGLVKRRNSMEMPENGTISNRENILDDDINSMNEGGESSNTSTEKSSTKVSIENENENQAIFPMFSEIRKLFQFRSSL